MIHVARDSHVACRRRPNRTQRLGVEALERRLLLAELNLVAPHEVKEGEALRFTFELRDDMGALTTSDVPFEIQLAVADAATVPGEDYMPFDSLVPFPSGTSSVDLFVGTIDDNAIEGTETFRVDIVEVTGGEVSVDTAFRVGTILDNEPLALARLEGPMNVSEGDGAVRYEVVVDVPEGTVLQNSSSFFIFPRGGTAESLSDFILIGGSDSTPPGATGEVRLPLTLEIVDDVLPEPPETLDLVLRFGLGGVKTENEGPFTVTVDDNDGDGTGTASVDPLVVQADSSGNELTFTYRAETQIDSGQLQIEIPNGWSPPQDSAAVTGRTTVSSDGDIGVPTFSGQTIELPVGLLAPDETMTVIYGDGGGSSGATVPAALGKAEFVFQLQASPSGTLKSLNASPHVEIVPTLDGTGKAQVVPSGAISESTGNSFSIRYTASGRLDQGAIQVTVPDVWTDPQGSSGMPGHTTITSDGTIGDPVFSGSTIDLPVTSLTAGEQVTFTYGAGGGTEGVTVPSQLDPAAFDFRVQGSVAGSLEPIDDPPVIFVVDSVDGSGLATVSPDTTSAGSTGNEIKITYTAALPLSNGEIRLQIPPRWSLPRAAGNRSGLTTVSSTGQIGEPDISGQMVDLPITNLAAGETVTFLYGTGGGQTGASAPADDGDSPFVISLRGSADGTLLPLVDSPVVTVTNAAGGSGTAQVNPRTIAAESIGNEIRIDFRAVGTMDGGDVQLEIPDGWSLPSNQAGMPGFTTVESSG